MHSTINVQQCKALTIQWERWHIFSLFTRIAIPLFTITFVLLYLLKILTYQWQWALWSVPIVFSIALWVTFRYEHWRLSEEKVVAYIDHCLGVKGQLMLLFSEQNNQHIRSDSVIDNPLRVPPKIWLAWWGLVFCFILLFFIPEKVPEISYPIIKPQFVSDMEELLTQLDKTQNHDFLAQAKKSLSHMVRKNGMKKEDFEALKRIQNELNQRLSAHQLFQKKPTQQQINQTMQEILRQPSMTQKQWEKLADQADKLQQQMKKGNAGAQAKKIAELLARAKKNLEGKQDPKQNAAQADAAQALNDLLKKLEAQARQHNRKSGPKHKGAKGISRGPGEANLNYTNINKKSNHQYTDLTFEASKGPPTVLLGETKLAMNEAKINEQHGQSSQEFSEGTQTQFSERHFRPKHQYVLEHYFNE